MEDLYLDMMLEREHSTFPQGFKHYRKDERFEITSLILSYLLYKVKCLFIGGQS